MKPRKGEGRSGLIIGVSKEEETIEQNQGHGK